MKVLAAILTALALSGCAHTGKNGVRTHVIVGFGVVRVFRPCPAGGSVLTVQALGLYAGGRSASLGYLNQTRTEIETNANIILDLKK